MKAVTDFHKFSGWFARSALALAIGALLPLAIYAQAGNPPEPGQEKNGELVALADAGEPAAAAADPAKPNPPAPAGSFRWTGVYVGGHFGYNWARANTSITPLPTAVQFVNLRPTALDLDPRGVFGGGQIGFNWQIRNTVLGVEFDISKDRHGHPNHPEQRHSVPGRRIPDRASEHHLVWDAARTVWRCCVPPSAYLWDSWIVIWP
jgi:opacity protein-like surface antigen